MRCDRQNPDDRDLVRLGYKKQCKAELDKMLDQIGCRLWFPLWFDNAPCSLTTFIGLRVLRREKKQGTDEKRYCEVRICQLPKQ